MSDENEELVLTEDEVTQNESNEVNIPKHRFDEVNNRYKQADAELARYKQFGDPDELARMVERNKSVPITETELEGYDAQLRAIPAFQKVYDFVERQAESTEKARSSFLDQAEGKFSDYAKNLGVPITEGKDSQALLYDIQAQVAEQIRRDPNLTARFMSNDMSAIDDAYQRASSTGLIGMLKKARSGRVHGIKTGGPKQPTNPRAAGASTVKSDKPLTENEMLAQAGDRGFDVLMSRSEE